MFVQGSCNIEQEEEGYYFTQYLDEGQCEKEEEYHPISEGDEESKDSIEPLEQERVHNSPSVLEVRS